MPGFRCTGRLFHGELCLLLLKEDLASGTAGGTTGAPENGAEQVLGCAQVIECFRTRVDMDVSVRLNDDTRFLLSWHHNLLDTAVREWEGEPHAQQV